MKLSWTGSRWALLDADPQHVAKIAAATGLSSVAARCVALRWEGVPDPGMLEPGLHHLHDPHLLLNMDRALERLARAARDGQRLRIITDYDVDGTTSSLILQAALKVVGPRCVIDYHIPNRFGGGYGFSLEAADKAVADGIDLIVHDSVYGATAPTVLSYDTSSMGPAVPGDPARATGMLSDVRDFYRSEWGPDHQEVATAEWYLALVPAAAALALASADVWAGLTLREASSAIGEGRDTVSRAG